MFPNFPIIAYSNHTSYPKSKEFFLNFEIENFEIYRLCIIEHREIQFLKALRYTSLSYCDTIVNANSDLHEYTVLCDTFLEAYYSCLPNIWKNYFGLAARRVTRAKNSRRAGENHI